MHSIRNFIAGMFYSNPEQAENKEIPAHLQCPLSKKIMTDPVVTITGHSYDRKSIMDYFSRFDEITPIPSPHDNSVIITREVFPNILLRNEIDEYSKNTITDVDVLYSIEHVKATDELDIAISLKPNSNASTVKKYITLVLDVSGSMDNSAAEIESGNGEKGFKFSRLDLIKHATKVVSQILTEDDYLSIITYSTDPKVVMDFTPMGIQGKAIADRAILAMRVEGATMIDKAVQLAFTHFASADIPVNANRSILLLTDGEPSDNVETIKQTVKQQMAISKNTTLSTFIFGNNANSKLLNNMAENGSGMYSYIPDASMIGTVFSNFIANVSNTVVNKATVVVRASDAKAPLYANTSDTSNTANTITITNLHQGCSRNILYKSKLPAGHHLTFEFDVITDTSTKTYKITSCADTNVENICVQNVRNTFIQILSELTRCTSQFFDGICITNGLNRLTAIIKSKLSIYPTNAFLLGMLRDIESSNPDEAQVTKAFSSQTWYKNWGEHYVLSVIRANWLEETSNYKTPSIAPYASDTFTKIRDDADLVFISIRPPEPSIKPMGQSSNAYVQPSAQTYQRTFYGGCLDGECPVDVSGGKKYMCDMQKGDVVIHSKGTSRVKCLVKHHTHDEDTEYAVLCKTDEACVLPLKITKWHPVKTDGIYDGQPTFPNDVVEFSKLPQTNYFVVEKPKHVYNMVMEDGDYPWFTVNGFECVALGHKETVNTVLAHDYYAEKVIDDLKLMDGWDAGCVTVSQKKVRDTNTSLVVGLTSNIS